MCDGDDPLVTVMPGAARRSITTHVRMFANLMPRDRAAGRLLHYARSDAGTGVAVRRILDSVIVDTASAGASRRRCARRCWSRSAEQTRLARSGRMHYGERMRETAVAGITLRLDPAEAGGRYLAPILILPGLFQSPACWRGMTSMLAHRGWNVYLLPRPATTDATGSTAGGWRTALTTAVRVASNLDTKVVVFGADIGASLALGLLADIRPLALALFAPAEPGHAADAYRKALGFFGRMRGQAGPDVAAPASIAKTAPRPTDPGTEPRAFVQDLIFAGDGLRPTTHPPALVFAPENDPLVAAEHAQSFAATPYAKLARAKLSGRWWPSSRWEPVADEVHRFLILTLADRVVEFPDEVIED